MPWTRFSLVVADTTATSSGIAIPAIQHNGLRARVAIATATAARAYETTRWLERQSAKLLPG
jgi:hypothetical protein